VFQWCGNQPDVEVYTYKWWHNPLAVSEVSEMATDPVCKMEVDPQTAAAKTEYEGETCYFCALGCKVAFEKDPEKYLKGAGAEGGH
jgi:YHS domain-containing protein